MRSFFTLFRFAKSKPFKPNKKNTDVPKLFRPIKKENQLKESPQIKELKRQMRIDQQPENMYRLQLEASQKPEDIYKKIDPSFERFFAKRPYDIKSFNFWIAVLGYQKQVEELDNVLDRMESLELQPSTSTYIQLIQAYGRLGDVEKAEYYHKLAEKEKGRSLQLYSALLFAYARTKNVEFADKLFAEIERNGMKPDIVTYTTLINAHYKAGNLQKCWDLFMDVRLGKSANPPDESIFGLMIEICAHTHDAEKAVSLFDMLQIFEPHQQTKLYNAYIKALGSRRDYGDKALDQFRQMVKIGIPIDSDTIVCTLKACSSIGDVKTAFDVVQMMKEKNIANNQYIQNMMIKVYAGACKLPFLDEKIKEMYIQDAWKIFKESEKKGWVTSYTLDSMCLLMANAGKLADLDGLVLPLYQDYSIQKTEKAYETVIRMMYEEERLLDVFRIKDMMLEKGQNLTFNITCYYLEAAIKAADEDKVVDALEWFKKIGRIPKFKYLKLLGEQDPLPVRIHAILNEFEPKFGFVKDKTFRTTKANKYIVT